MSQMSWNLNKAAASTQVDSEDESTSSKKKSGASGERKPLTVSALNKQIRESLESQFPRFWLKGELSNFTAHGSGHWYFSLKDSKSQISGVMFRGQNSRIRFKPQTGQEVIVFGRISVYEPRGGYQVYVEHMEPAGEGALQAAFEQLKNKLSKEGLFDSNKKRPLPEHPKHIVVVTSPTGAAIRDILNILKRRYRAAKVTVIPAVVQGAQAAPKIVEALEMAKRLRDADVLIVGRGGGSMEDLWCFNDEAVARTVASMPMPVISAVGHEIDFTICDFVADLRAPTPSAAAELVVKNTDDLLERLHVLKKGLYKGLLAIFAAHRQRLEFLKKRLVDPRRTLQAFAQKCDELEVRLKRAIFRKLELDRQRVVQLRKALPHPRQQLMRVQSQLLGLTRQLQTQIKNQLSQSQNKLARSMAMLDSLSPLRVVDRGYSLVQDEKKQVIKSVQQVSKSDTVDIRVTDGTIKAVVSEIKKQLD